MLIVTLLSDFGTRDATAAMARARIAAAVPAAEITDLTHNVPLHSQREAAYMLARTYGYFPVGTLHIAPVSLFVGKAPAMALATENGHYFLAPDNGLLPLALGEDAVNDARLCYRYPKPYSAAAWIEDAAFMAQCVAQGKPLPEKKIGLQALKPLLPLQHSSAAADCRVLRVDRYGNVALEIDLHQFAALTGGRNFSIEITKNEPITKLSHHYHDVPLNKPLCRFNTAGLLEIAVNHGSASELLQLQTGNPARLYYNTVRIRVQ